MYTWKNKEESTEFEVQQEGRCLVGKYTGEKESHVIYTTKLELVMDSPAVMPKGWWAQEGYMRTDPAQKGLDYMLTYAAGMLARKHHIDTIYVSSGSVAGGGQVFIASLGGKVHMDQEFDLEKGGTVNLPGYILKVEKMVENARPGYERNGWELVA